MDCKTQDGDRILTKVCSLGHVELLEFLIVTCGMNPELAGLKNKLPIERAGETGDFAMANKLVELNAELKSIVLHAAAETGQVAFASLRCSL